MKFWKEHVQLRVTVILVLFVISLALIFSGWKMTGDLKGLGMMVLGTATLLAALAVYNAPFTDPKKK